MKQNLLAKIAATALLGFSLLTTQAIADGQAKRPAQPAATVYENPQPVAPSLVGEIKGTLQAVGTEMTSICAGEQGGKIGAKVAKSLGKSAQDGEELGQIIGRVVGYFLGDYLLKQALQ